MKSTVKNMDKKILFETHLHTVEISPCAQVSYTEIPEIYLNAGYGGIIVTDHYSPYALNVLPQSTLDAKIDQYFRVAHKLAEEGARKGLQVLIGAEVTIFLRDLPQDFLIYGDIEKPFRKRREVYDFCSADLYKFCLDHNFLMFQAHPLRSGWALIEDFKNLHGLEVFNGNNHADNAYARTVALCEKHKLMQIAGGDFHGRGFEGRAGIYLPKSCRTVMDFIGYYRNNTPELYIKTEN